MGPESMFYNALTFCQALALFSNQNAKQGSSVSILVISNMQNKMKDIGESKKNNTFAPNKHQEQSLYQADSPTELIGGRG